MKNKLRGTYTVIVTPFTEDGFAVNETMLRWLVDYQIEEGIHGLIPLASNGELLSLTDEERHEVARITVEQAAGRVPVVVSTTHESTDFAIRYTRDAEALGADAAMVMTPYYAWIDEEEIYTHFRRIAEAVSIPIMLYNHPASTVLDMRPELVARLAEIDNISYVKESSGDIARVDAILRLAPGRITVFAGYHACDSIRLGAKGWVSVCGNIVPRLSADVYDLPAKHGDPGAGRATYHRLLPLLDAISGDLYVSATKAAMEIVGMPVGPPRPPRLPLPAPQTAALRAVLAELDGAARDLAA